MTTRNRFAAVVTALSVLGIVCTAQDLRTPPPTSAPAAAATPSGISALLEARRLREAGELRKALNIVRDLRGADERNLDLLNEEGELCWLLNDFDGARKAFTAARGYQANDYRANVGLGRVWAGARQWRQAAYYFETAVTVATAERRAETLAALAGVYQNGGEVAKGLPIAKKAVETDPTNFEARQIYVQFLVRTGDFKAARDEAALLVERAREEVAGKPGDIDALQKLSRAYQLRIDIVRESHTRLYQATPDGSRSDILLPGKEKEATENLKDLVDLMVRQSELNLTFAYLDTLAFAEQAVTYQPGDVAALVLQGQLQRSVGQAEKAAETFAKVLEIDPNHVLARRMLDELGPPPSTQPASDAAAPTDQPAKPATEPAAPPVSSTPPVPLSAP